MQKKKGKSISNKINISNKIKISNSIRTSLIIISIVIFSIGSANIIKLLSKEPETIVESKELYAYTNKSKLDSKINLKYNKYVKEADIIEGQLYLSDLISNIDMDLKYEYTDSMPTQVTYSYKIETVLNSIYSNTRISNDVLNKTEIIKEEKDKIANSSDLSINEKVTIDYQKYHELVKSFKQQMGISADSYLYVKLTVNTKANIGTQDIENEYVSDYKIGIGDKVALINEEEGEEEVASDSVKVETKMEQTKEYKEIAINTVVMLAGIILFVLVLKRTEKINTIKNKYKLELNRILRSCETKLVQIEDLKQIDIEHATRVKDMQQLLILSEESLVPIYCYIKDEPEEEAYFIVTKYEKSYVFILK